MQTLLLALCANIGRDDKCRNVGEFMKSSIVLCLESFSATESWLYLKERRSILPAGVDPELLMNWTVLSVISELFYRTACLHLMAKCSKGD